MKHKQKRNSCDGYLCLRLKQGHNRKLVFACLLYKASIILKNHPGSPSIFPSPKRKIINCQSALTFPIVLSSLELTFSAFNLVLHCTFIKFRVTYATESYALMMYGNFHFPYIGFYSSWIDLHLLSLWFSCPFCKLCAAFPYVFSPTPMSSFPRNNWTGGEEEKVSLMLHLVEEGLSNAKDITCYGAQPGCVG